MLLGCLMLSSEAVSSVADVLRPDDFYAGKHQALFEAITALWSRGEPVDAVSVIGELRNTGQLVKAGGDLEVADIAANGTVASAAPRYAELVREAATLRRVILAAQEVIQGAQGPPSDVYAFAGDAAVRMADTARERPRAEAVRLDAAAKAAIENLENARAAGLFGLSTGFDALDRLIAGLQPGNLLILAARPSVGKTALACQIARSVAEKGTGVVLFSLEMSQSEIALRLLCTESDLSSHKMRLMQYEMQGDDWRKLGWAETQFSGAPMWIVDSDCSSITQVRQRARKLRDKIGLVVVDYLQLMVTQQRYDSRQQEVSEISRGLKELARELEVPVLACAQLNREIEHRGDPKPRLSDLRDSGQIEQDADVVMFLHPRPTQSDVLEVIVAKHRNGPIGTVALRFIPGSTKFLPMIGM